MDIALSAHELDVGELIPPAALFLGSPAGALAMAVVTILPAVMAVCTILAGLNCAEAGLLTPVKRTVRRAINDS